MMMFVRDNSYHGDMALRVGLDSSLSLAGGDQAAAEVVTIMLDDSITSLSNQSACAAPQH